MARDPLPALQAGILTGSQPFPWTAGMMPLVQSRQVGAALKVGMKLSGFLPQVFSLTVERHKAAIDLSTHSTGTPEVVVV